jgi:predicted transcriptional regulator
VSEAEHAKPCPRCGGTGRIRDEAAFGAAVKAMRTGARVTLREVAAHTGLSVGYISDLEHGRKRWRGGLIIAYGDAVERLK